MKMKRFWIKLYIEILDDPKMGQLPDWLWRRAIELFLLAGENGNDGLLQPVTDLAWRLRTSLQKLTESLVALSEVGVVHETPQGWLVTNFKKRQYSESMERTRRYRTRNGDRHSDGVGDGISDGAVTDDESISYSVSDSSLEERCVGGETKPPPSETPKLPNRSNISLQHRPCGKSWYRCSRRLPPAVSELSRKAGTRERLHLPMRR